ncbi:hypothetical protein NFI96_025089 [Prochilodus magdalenae]|nr:hypothetical protein NFI96_025089 [Prochilodus magdalenae]
MVGKKKKILIASIVVICVICITVPLAVILTQRKSCPDGSFRNAAVAADSEPCSGVGREILKSGGSAADGAIAALLCTSVIHPQSNGIGGGAIFTIRDKYGEVRIINARETVPKVFKGDLSDCLVDSAGPQWIGVPGEIRGYELVHRLYGKLPWAELFNPTIKLAREGVKINKILARYLAHVEKHSAGELFRDAEGNMLKEGDTVKFEKLAETLEKIAERGADEFYTGETARALISDIQDAVLHLSNVSPLQYLTTPILHLPNTSPLQYLPSPIPHLPNTSPLQYFTSAIPHLPNTSPLQYLTSPKPHRSNTSPLQYLTSPMLIFSNNSPILHLSNTSPLQYLTSAIRHLPKTSPLQYLTAPIPHHSNTSPLQYLTSAIRHLPKTSPLQYLTAPIPHHSNTSPLQYLTSAIRHLPKTSPPQYLTAPIPHRSNTSLLQYLTAPIPHCSNTSPLQYLTAPIPHHSNTSPLQYLTAPMLILSNNSPILHLSNTSPLQYLTAPIPQRSNTSPLQYLTAPIPHRSNTSPLQCLSSPITHQYFTSPIPHLSNTSPLQYLTAPIPHLSNTSPLQNFASPNTSPFQYLTSLIHHLYNTSPPQNLTSPKPHLSNTSPLQYFTSPVLHLPNTSPLQCLTSPIPHLSNASPLQHCTSPILHLHSTSPLQSVTSPISHHSNTSPPQYLTSLKYLTSPIPHLSNTSPPQYLTSPIRHLSNTSPLQYLTSPIPHVSNTSPPQYFTSTISGNLTLEDLSSVNVSETSPWNVSLGNYTMFFPPPPSRGALVGFILNVMEGYNPSPASLEGRERVLTYHRFIEASKFAAGLRDCMKDPRFNPEKVGYAGIFRRKACKIIQKEFAENIRGKIKDDRTHEDEYYNITENLDTPSTTHVSVLDKDGMAVSATSTINYLFGSGVLSSKTGIILNNMMTDFCGTTDQVHPGERPPSYSAPTILHSNATNHTVIIGGAGGSRIPTGITMALMNFLWFGKSLKDSIAAPLVIVSKQDFLFEPDFDKVPTLHCLNTELLSFTGSHLRSERARPHSPSYPKRGQRCLKEGRRVHRSSVRRSEDGPTCRILTSHYRTHLPHLLTAGFITGLVLCITWCKKPSPDVRFSKAAVAADSERCSGIGRDILKRGGSAADGAIAALLCTSVINPQSNGIGGGAIFTIRDRNGTVKTINARETVPKNFKDLSDCSADTTGPQWIGVPGEIRGYERVHRLYGRLPWSRLFQPTIHLARDGVKISKTLAGYLHQVEKHSTRQLFVDAEGNMLKEGDTVKFEKLAETLENISKGGADEFYTGETARALISDIQDAGGTLTLEDLSSVEVSDVDPWNVSLRNYTILISPLHLQGCTVSFILNVMEGYNPSPASLEGRERVLTYHRFIEASKFAKGLGSRIKDPRFNPTEVGHAKVLRG